MAVDAYGPKGQPQFLDAGAPDTAVDPTKVGEYAGFTGNRIVGSTAQRNAFSHPDWPHLTAPWEGLEWYDTTLKHPLVYRNAGWVPSSAKTIPFAQSADVNGFIVINHNMGFTPVGVQAIASSQVTDAVTKILSFRDWARTSTTVTLRAVRSDSPPDYYSGPASGVATLHFL